MSNFTNDLQLLTELQSLIDESKRTATMDKTTTEIAGAISPIVKALIPLAKKERGIPGRRSDTCTGSPKRTHIKLVPGGRYETSSFFTAEHNV